MTTDTTTWRVPLWAWLPLSAAIAAEAVSNGLRAYSLGAHLERFTLAINGTNVSISGVVLVLAAIAVTASQARAAWVALTPGGAIRQRIVAGLAAILLLAVSITAMSSHLLEAQRAKVSDESGDRGKHDRAKEAYDTANAELATLKDQRATELVAADLNAAPVPRAVFNRTKQCTEVTRDDSYRDCKPILDLRQENGRALRKRELEKDVPKLKAALDALPRPAEATAAEEGTAGVWGWLMGLAVVFVATFGSVIFSRIDGSTIAATISEQSSAEIDWGNLPAPSMFGGDLPEPPKPGRRQPLPKTSNVVEFRGKHPVIAALESAGGSVASNLALAELMGCCPPESSKRVQEVIDRLEIRRVGKEKRIALRA